MGNGTAITRHVAAGCDVHLLCATRGGAGWNGLPPGRRPEELPAIRTEELKRAAAVLGLAGVEVWDYPDGGVASCDRAELTARIAATVERIDPDVVAGWGPDGGYGHPDHIAVGACTDAALAGSGRALYHLGIDRKAIHGFQEWWSRSGLGDESPPLIAIDHVDVVFEPTPAELEIIQRAVACHTSQLNAMYTALIADPGGLYWFARGSYARIAGAPAALATGTFPELA
jgi:LmbE family N-acetylglucosaminyl deacetylase